MRTVSRLALSAAVLGGGLLITAPASAQEVCAYPFDCPIGGGDGGPGSGGGDTDTNTGGGAGGGGTVVGGGAGGGGTVVSGGAGGAGGGGTFVSGGAAGGAGTLPFTGGEVTLLALAGTAALSGGIVLVAAARKRPTV